MNSLQSFLNRLEEIEEKYGIEYTYKCLKKSCKIVLERPEEFTWKYDGKPPNVNECSGPGTWFISWATKLYFKFKEERWLC